MKFAMLYSCGKDSALALQRLIQAGHRPVCLITTYNPAAGRSWFHGVSPELLAAVEQNLGLPLLRCACTGEDYHRAVEDCLTEAKLLGAEAAAFGDIDIEEHLSWNRERCANSGLDCLLPLWQEPRQALVYEAIDTGLRAVIKCVDCRCLDESFLGQTLTRQLVGQIAARGADLCGENGEYHTFVYDGPIFQAPIPLRHSKPLNLGSHAVIDLIPTPAAD